MFDQLIMINVHNILYRKYIVGVNEKLIIPTFKLVSKATFR